MEIITRLREFRITGYAVFDLAAAFLGVFLLSPFLSKLSRKAGWEVPKQNWLYLTLPAGIVTRLAIGRVTPLTRDFIDPHAHYILKAVIIGLSVLGSRNIKKVSGALETPKPVTSNTTEQARKKYE